MRSPSNTLLWAFFACTLFLTGSLGIFAQNLVVNSSFEDFSACPTAQGQFNLVNSWQSASDGTPDYFNSCATLAAGVDIPDNYQGTQTARTGDAYMGILVWGEDDIREYIISNFNAPMVVGQNYCVSYYVNRSDVSQNGIVELGAYLSTSPVLTANGSTNLEFMPQIENDTDDPIQEEDEWVKVSQIITADQAYQYITIGNFNDNENTTGGSNQPGTPFLSPAYYYIEDVSVTPFDMLTVNMEELEVCEGEVFTLSASGGNDNSYYWYRADEPEIILGTNSSLPLSANSSGTYIVSAEIGNCEATASIDVKVWPNPIADFELAGGCTGFGATVLTATAVNLTSETTYEWDVFNDGVIDAVNGGGITFPSDVAGSYEVKLTVSNGALCSDSVIKTITVTDDCNYCDFPPNFIPNHNFEQFIECPDSLENLTSLLNWYQTTTEGSFDFFHSCVEGENPPLDDPDAPANTFGFQDALSGQGYGGFYAYNENSNYREYASVRLNQPLIPGTVYCTSFNLSLAEVSSRAVKNVGLYFSADSISLDGQTDLPYMPQFETDGEFITDTNNWLQFGGDFIPTDTIHFVTIGNFRGNVNTEVMEVTSTNPQLADFAYYYVDDVAIFEKPDLNLPDLTTCGESSVTVSIDDLYCQYIWTRLSDGEVVSTDPSFVLNDNEDLAGDYTLMVIAGGCSVVDTFKIASGGQTEASFQVIPNCAGKITTLTSTSTGIEPGSLYYWDLDGDLQADSLNQGSIGVIYPDAGFYNVSLWVVNPSGCSDTASLSFSVVEDCDPCDGDNLVFNSGFEFYNSCPDELGQFDLANDWMSPDDAEADLYNGCAGNSDVGVPNNIWGDAPAYDGVGYGGFLAFNNNNQRTYLMTEMIDATIPGQQYCVSMKVRLSDHSGKSIDRIGAFFSTSTDLPDVPVPQVVNEESDILAGDTWHTVNALFTPQVAHNYVTIGNFYPNGFPDLNVGNITTPPPNDTAYYYIDQVIVSPVDLEVTGDQMLCKGESTELTAVTNLCEHQWTTEADPFTILSITETLEVTPDSTTTYIYTGANNLCDGVSFGYTVTVFEQPFLGPDQTICSGSEVTLSAGTEAQTYSWSPASLFTDPTAATQTLFIEETTEISVSVTYANPSNCPLTDEIVISVTEDVFTAGGDASICSATPTQLFATGGTSYVWTPDNSLDNPNSDSPVASPFETTVYTVEIINDDLGCNVFQEVTVTVVECDTGGPSWVDENGNSLDDFCVETNWNTNVDIDVPDVSDPDDPNESFDYYLIQPEGGSVEFIEGPDTPPFTQIEYNPSSSTTGVDNFELVVCDESFPIECDTVDICIEIPNTAPIFTEADTMYYTIFQDSAFVDCPDIFDAEDNLIDSLIWVTLPNFGEPAVVNNSCLQYWSNDDYLGVDSLIVAACDEEGLCDTLWVYITVLDWNFPPEAVDMLVTAIENTPTDICFSWDDADLPEDTHTIELCEGDPAHGTVNDLDLECLEYLPDSGYLGNDTINLKICDEIGFCDTLTIYITIVESISANDDVVCVQTNVPNPFLPATNDAPSNPDTIYLANEPSNGLAIFTGDTLTYIPGTDFTGSDSFDYVICVGFECDTATIDVSVGNFFEAINDTVTAISGALSNYEVLENDLYPDTESLSITLVSGPNHGEAQANQNFTINYLPEEMYEGPDTIVYELCYVGKGCSEATVFITVLEEGALIANDDFATVSTTNELFISVLVNDEFTGEVDVKLVTPPANGSAEVIDGQIFYNPDNGFVGTDSLQYALCNQDGEIDNAWVYIVVTEELCAWDGTGTPTINIQGGISPNADGKNDKWVISDLLTCEQLQQNELIIFNRYGNNVFEATNYGSADWWDGTWDGNELPVGTYFYVIKFTDLTSDDMIRGSIEVFR